MSISDASDQNTLPEQSLETLDVTKLDPYDPVVMARQVRDCYSIYIQCDARMCFTGSSCCVIVAEREKQRPVNELLDQIVAVNDLVHLTSLWSSCRHSRHFDTIMVIFL